jgi:hypothetical protein
VFELEELNLRISTLHVENLCLRASEIALGSQLKKEGKVAAHLDGHRVCSAFPILPSRSLSFIFTPNVVLVSHSIIGYPFPNDCHESATLPLRLGPLTIPTLHLLETIPDHWVSKLFLHFRHGYHDAVYITNSPQLRYCSRFSIYFDGVSHLTSLPQSC